MNSNTETVKPIRDIRWFWWQWRIRRFRKRLLQLRLLTEQYDDNKAVRLVDYFLSYIDEMVECTNKLYNCNYEFNGLSNDRKYYKKVLKKDADIVKIGIDILGPLHNALRTWRHFCFRRNLRDFVRLISCAKSLINCRELNRELGIGSARKYTYDTDPFIECYNSYIREIVVLMKSSHELFMVRDSCYKSFLGRRFEARRIRNAIAMLYWRYYYFPDPDK